MAQNGGRVVAVDMLRGFAIGIVIFLHAIAEFFHVEGVFPVWDYFHYAVAAFLFCSAYVFWVREWKKPTRLLPVRRFVSGLWKRFIRLYRPWLVFAAVYLAVVWVLNREAISPDLLLDIIFLQNGIDISWLVLLFVQMALLLPFLAWAKGNARWLLISYSVMAVVFSVYLFFGGPGPLAGFVVPFSGLAVGEILRPFPSLGNDWRAIMWLPWSLVVIATSVYIDTKDSPARVWSGIAGIGLLVVALFLLQHAREDTWGLTHNKYPPDLLFISYGLFWTGVLMQVFSLPVFSGSGVAEKAHYTPQDKERTAQPVIRSVLVSPLTWLSLNSYPLFFVHYLVIYVSRHLPGPDGLVGMPWIGPWSYFAIVLVASVIVQLAINRTGRTVAGMRLSK